MLNTIRRSTDYYVKAHGMGIWEELTVSSMPGFGFGGVAASSGEKTASSAMLRVREGVKA